MASPDYASSNTTYNRGMSLKPYLQRVGVGPRGSKDLTREEAREANNLILSGEVHPVEFGALTMAMRVKGEADSELIGAVDAFHDHCDPTDWEMENLVTLASPLDGKDRLMVWTPASTLLAAACGAKVLVLSDRDVPPKKGITPSIIFEALGYSLARSFSEAADQIRERGWSCVEVSQAIPGLNSLKEWRELLGKRPYLSTCEKLINPAKGALITGVFHGPVLRQMDHVVRELGYPKTLVVQGTQGSVDLKASAPTNVCLIKEGSDAEMLKMDPSEFGLLTVAEELLPSGIEGCARLSREVLKTHDHHAKPAVVYNAALQVWIAMEGRDFRDCIEQTQSHFDSVGLD